MFGVQRETTEKKLAGLVKKILRIFSRETVVDVVC